MNIKREEKALFEFKHIMDDLMQLLGKSTGAVTGYLYWVNRSRRQFVLETSYKILPNVMFRDRIAFEDFFLNKYSEIDTPLQLEIGRNINSSDLHHYYDVVPVKHLTIIPFQNNGETVALTVLESEEKPDTKELENSIAAYKNAHINVLNTYLELTDLYDDQKKWIDYDESIDQISSNMEDVAILNTMVEMMQSLVPGGGVVAALRGMDTWVTVLKSEAASGSPAMGLMVEEKSLAYDALQKGKSLFSIHFNQNPKRISSSETSTEGATLAIPVLISDRRHAVVLAYDKNPLRFKESTKHMLKNIVRVAAFAIQSNMNKVSVQNDLFTTEYGNFTQVICDLVLQKQLRRLHITQEKAYFGLIGIDNLSELRSRLRLEELKKLQRLVVKALNPSRLGFNGIIGFNSDYVFSYLFSASSEEEHNMWLNTNISDLSHKLDFGDGRNIGVHIKAGSIKLDKPGAKPADIVNAAKHGLSMAMKNKNTAIVNM